MTVLHIADDVVEHLDRGPLQRDEIAAQVAALLPAGSFVNLGIGLPTLVAGRLGPDANVTLHTENGLLGMGPPPADGEIDADLINAGKQPVTELPGAPVVPSPRDGVCPPGLPRRNGRSRRSTVQGDPVFGQADGTC